MFGIWRKLRMKPVGDYRLARVKTKLEITNAAAYLSPSVCVCDSLPHIILIMPLMRPCDIMRYSTLISLLS